MLSNSMLSPPKNIYRQVTIQKGEAAVTELEIQIVQAMREASDERLAMALAYLIRLESEETRAAVLPEDGVVA